MTLFEYKGKVVCFAVSIAKKWTNTVTEIDDQRCHVKYTNLFCIKTAASWGSSQRFLCLIAGPVHIAMSLDIFKPYFD